MSKLLAVEQSDSSGDSLNGTGWTPNVFSAIGDWIDYHANDLERSSGTLVSGRNALNLGTPNQRFAFHFQGGASNTDEVFVYFRSAAGDEEDCYYLWLSPKRSVHIRIIERIAGADQTPIFTYDGGVDETAVVSVELQIFGNRLQLQLWDGTHLVRTSFTDTARATGNYATVRAGGNGSFQLVNVGRYLNVYQSERQPRGPRALLLAA